MVNISLTNFKPFTYADSLSFNLAPASPPINIMTTVLSSTEIMVTWGPVPPVDQNGIITEYEVMFEPLETFSGTITTQTANVTAPAMSVILTGLQAFVNYSISVRAYTRIGAGPFSTVITNMTHEDGEYKN